MVRTFVGVWDLVLEVDEACLKQYGNCFDERR